MPIYLFRCDDCNQTMERSFPIKEAIINPSCTQCDRPMKRLWNTPAITFKGTGWGKDG